MNRNSSNHEIRIYEDPTLLKLEGEMALLESERINFFLSNIQVNEKGRSIRDVVKDKVEIAKKLNQHLIENYPGNSVAERWIAVNSFLADRNIENYLI